MFCVDSALNAYFLTVYTVFSSLTPKHFSLYAPGSIVKTILGLSFRFENLDFEIEGETLKITKVKQD